MTPEIEQTGNCGAGGGLAASVAWYAGIKCYHVPRHQGAQTNERVPAAQTAGTHLLDATLRLLLTPGTA